MPPTQTDRCLNRFGSPSAFTALPFRVPRFLVSIMRSSNSSYTPSLSPLAATPNGSTSSNAFIDTADRYSTLSDDPDTVALWALSRCLCRSGRLSSGVRKGGDKAGGAHGRLHSIASCLVLCHRPFDSNAGMDNVVDVHWHHDKEREHICGTLLMNSRLNLKSCWCICPSSGLSVWCPGMLLCLNITDVIIRPNLRLRSRRRSGRRGRHLVGFYGVL